MTQRITPFLMFTDAAEQAMRFYVSLFSGSTIDKIERFGPGEPGAEGSFKRAEFTLAGQRIICFDSSVQHAFTFTPSFSLFVDCDSEAELDSAFTQLVENGTVLMAPGNYGFSKKFAWLNDRFGVSWQLNYGSP